MKSHSVEKIGGTSMANTSAVLDNVLLPQSRRDDPYHRIIVVSAYAGITNKLLENKHTREPGVYSLYSRSDLDWAWSDGLTDVARCMRGINADIFQEALLLEEANQFVHERIEGMRNCLIDLQRLCSFGQFRLAEHLVNIREMLAGLGEAHSAFNTVLMLRARGMEARFVDLTGWRDEHQIELEARIDACLGPVQLHCELPIVTGYTQCCHGTLARYGRGYTEVTFSHIAARTGAREAIIHKEYHLSSADPNLVGGDRATKIGNTNYDVADQLSNMGMEAVHPNAAKVLRQASIPLRVRNTFDPADPGTLIRDDYVSSEPGVEIIAGQRNLYALRVFDQDMVGTSGADRKILERVEDCGLRVVSKDINANTVTHYVTGTLSRAKKTISALQELFPNGTIDLERIALVSAIGSDLAVPGLLARVVNALVEEDIEIVALHQGMRQVDIQIVIRESDYENTVRTLHRNLVEVTDNIGQQRRIVA